MKKTRKVIFLMAVILLALFISVKGSSSSELPELLPGDIIFTKNKVLGIAEHVAIYVGNGLVVQAVPMFVEVVRLVDLEENWAFKWFGGIGSIYRVSGATDGERQAVAEYALNQVGEIYDWTLSPKWCDYAWYCFKLVWRSWYEGTNGRIDLDPYGRIVWSWDLMNSPYVYKIYP